MDTEPYRDTESGKMPFKEDTADHFDYITITTDCLSRYSSMKI